jgi:hypothetical protein
MSDHVNLHTCMFSTCPGVCGARVIIAKTVDHLHELEYW